VKRRTKRENDRQDKRRQEGVREDRKRQAGRDRQERVRRGRQRQDKIDRLVRREVRGLAGQWSRSHPTGGTGGKASTGCGLFREARLPLGRWDVPLPSP
jgi:hypothetical protein